MSRLQENVRISYDYLSREIRMAGSGYSCLSSIDAVNNVLNNATDFDQQFDTIVRGYDNTEDNLPSEFSSKVKDGTDVLVVRGSYGTGAKLESAMDSSTAVLSTTVMDPTPFGTGDIVVITDCRTASIFQVTSYTDSTGETVHDAGGSTTPGNATSSFPYAYPVGSSVIKVRTTSYYVGTNEDGNSALFVRNTDEGSAETYEIVEGIADMQLEYAVDTNSDGYPDGYKTAADISTSQWDQVISVRVSLLAESLEDNVTETPTPYQFYQRDKDDLLEDITPTDRKIRRSSNFVVAIRSRVSNT
ncbi:PilW family protein [Oceanobacter sp. 3_MG-2023]|uniref:PilW family protein n=1 Tax=Oceanobacter sp. 3_MG-2023 TaxID=3062622 RepID=UPI00273310C8|nr:PilW family protein [Oceanobacter sp. 3_MG-2023]MDP2506240.1 PilW family protein [Oceanobacter sp. 3_MG-2023]